MLSKLFSCSSGPRKSTDPPDFKFPDFICNEPQFYKTNQQIKEEELALERQRKWDIRFLELAQFISRWSKDKSTKVGGVIVDGQNRVVSVGYNGFAKGVKDSDERLDNREIKYKIVCHGEMNAILFSKRDLTGCTLYTWPFGCCSNCAAYVIQTGISRVVFPKTDNPRWTESIALSKQIWDEAGILWDEVDFSIDKTT